MRLRALPRAAAVAVALLLALDLAEPAAAHGGSPSPLDGVCNGDIHYTFSPALQATPRPTTITWSGAYSCTSVPGLQTWTGRFGGSVHTTTGCLQADLDQVLAQGVTENDKWFVHGDEQAGSSTLTGTVSTLPREDGTRLYEWTGTVAGGSWFAGHHFNGNGVYTSLTSGKACLAGEPIERNDGYATLVILPL
ncbi:hypothetical protein ACGFOU_09595 [Streptomyces sp. NPDC048595]|uniref:hypothetical protein n=1 Tax=Streptomyces sp. NPDC048595 TaxID=3365576 RepID=UPI003723FB81